MSNAYRSVLESGGVAPTGDAVAADVLAGKTFSNANAVGVTGTMVNRGAVSETVTPGQSYTIPEGYHNGNGVVSCPITAPKFITIAREEAGYYSAISNIGTTPLAASHDSNATGTYEGYSWNRTSGLSLTVPVAGTYFTCGPNSTYATAHVSANETISSLGYLVTFFPD